MKPRQIIRILVDIAMTILLLLLMAFMLTGQQAHEWLGAAELVLFIAHHILNARWMKNVGRGRYSPFRILQTALAVLVLVTMLGSMVSGIMMSRYAFSFLDIHGGMSLARTMHLVCAYWGFVFLSAHLGLHWSMMMGSARKLTGIKKPSKSCTVVLRLLALGLAGYGVYAFAKNQITDYLFLRSHFVFYDDTQSPAQFSSEYLAMMGLFAAVCYYLGCALQNRKKKDGNHETI